MVSVAVIATLAALTPLAAQMPSPSTAFWNSSIAHRIIRKVNLYMRDGRRCICAAVHQDERPHNFFGVNLPDGESSLRAIIVEPS